jgi:hypothetical protein
MTPPSGTWIGTFVPTGFNRGVQITLTLNVQGDGSITGSFDVDNQNAPWWTGPIHGAFDKGGYTPYGSLHLAEEGAEAKGNAVLDARFNSVDANSAVLWGTILIEVAGRKQGGTLVAIFAERVGPADELSVRPADFVSAPHVWGN